MIGEKDQMIGEKDQSLVGGCIMKADATEKIGIRPVGLPFVVAASRREKP